jgi:hypothetical protein
MASYATGGQPTLSSVYPHITPEAVQDFHETLLESTHVLALIGAGLSASSGLPTFRGAGGLWRTHEATELATPQAFTADPGLVWQFYSYRRHMALKAKPNKAHYALAELAKKMPGFQSLTQNVDGEKGATRLSIFFRGPRKWESLTLGIRTVDTRQSSSPVVASSSRIIVRYKMHPFLLQLRRTRQLQRPHRARSRLADRRV